MYSLHDLQLGFMHGLLHSTEEAAARLIRAGGVSAEQRLAIYRHNFFSHHREALRAVYPVIERVVGAAFFRHTADRFIHCSPSRSGDIHQFGEEFSEFLAAFPPARELPYLPDIAKLEWLVHQTFHAAEAPGLPLERLAAIPPEHCLALTFTLHPACRLLASPYPVQDIWQVNQPDWDGDQSVDLSRGGVRLLVRRNRFSVQLVPLESGEFAMLAALAAGRDIAGAHQDTLRLQPAFDVAAFLQRHVFAGTLAGFKAPKNRIAQRDKNVNSA